MALIKCSECGNQISDRAEVCIHCGCPVSEMDKQEVNNNIVEINGRKCDLSQIIEYKRKGALIYAIRDLREMTGLGLAEAKSLVDNLDVHSDNIGKTIYETKCPRCGSTEFQMVPRKWSLATGIFTNKVDRVCVKCKKKF
ncbi:zinc-ribbon domain-containing protein [Dethiosulfatibacter aminovorans DSM 17477]|uniref:Zinc-ribbon domain-containing protein n=1 Tax=Dethiosulfatibacter aminovorans DSM 17477 TaxID=1121476 RepID=A0A1M6G0N9_9FIRM|nr:zinc-ribbon domain-containing protein [Dethiosulfatibacter aminovorans]SHJ03454.1 zinc-ribbon domain-containing protein [Dethiosulfatibacter aminovorans DSM 17477]